MQVMLVVKTLVKSGMTIVATIHSPTPFCFNLFDRMMILLGGHCVYNGHNGALYFCMSANLDICFDSMGIICASIVICNLECKGN